MPEDPVAHFILPHQNKVYDRLIEVGGAFLAAARNSHCKIRGHTLLLGPSGTGKSHLASCVSTELKIPLISVSVGEWSLLGSNRKSSSATWSTLWKFLKENRTGSGAVIFLDEIDKVSMSSEWTTYLRLEVFMLLDGKIPNGLLDDDETIDSGELRAVGEFLREHCFILGAGAFQDLLESREKPALGFQRPDNKQDSIHLDQLSKILPRELTNRFRSEVLALPTLSAADYLSILNATEELLPEHLREIFIEVGRRSIPGAVRDQKGVRMLEEVLLESQILKRKGVVIPRAEQLELNLSETRDNFALLTRLIKEIEMMGGS